VTETRLAITGADPAFPAGPPKWPKTDERITESVLSALQSGNWGSYDSDTGDTLVQSIEKQFSIENVMVCSSGTIAVELALRGVGIKAGDEVLLAAYDFPGNFRAIEAIGARPVLIDVVQNGWLIDLEKVTAAISDQTRAILVSHLHGHVVDMQRLKTIAERHNLKVVEDACQVAGGSQHQKPLGSFGDAGVLSFGGSKLLSAGRGGAVLSQDPTVIQRARIFGSRGNEAFPLSQLQAAALLPQIHTLPNIAMQRHRGTTKLHSLLAQEDFPIEIPNSFGQADCVAPYKFPLWVPAQLRQPFVECLTAEGVAVGEGFRGFAGRTARRCRKPMELVNSQRAAKETVLIHHPVLLESDSYLERLAETIAKVSRYVSEQVQ
jgi:dTDP-4-amino-4,6-dideoxygalactose transaminase